VLAESVVLAAAITLVFVRGGLFKRVRALWPTFFECPLCVGVWVGAACFIALQTPAILELEPLRAVVLILGEGSATGVLAFGIHQLFDTLTAVENWKR
jgi:hypothetical protein